jgi:hypothetical protein
VKFANQIEQFLTRENAIAVAKLNGETVREQRDRYDIEIRRLHSDYQEQLRARNLEIEQLKKALAELARRRDKSEKELRDLYDVMEHAVIPDPTRPAEFATLFYLYESHEYRERCRDCGDLSCTAEGGCGAEVRA